MTQLSPQMAISYSKVVDRYGAHHRSSVACEAEASYRSTLTGFVSSRSLFFLWTEETMRTWIKRTILFYGIGTGYMMSRPEFRSSVLPCFTIASATDIGSRLGSPQLYSTRWYVRFHQVH